MSVTGPHTLEMHSCGVENSRATGFLPRTWLNDTECMLSGGTRVVSSGDAAVRGRQRVGGDVRRALTDVGIGEDAATAISPGGRSGPAASA